MSASSIVGIVLWIVLASCVAPDAGLVKFPERRVVGGAVAEIASFPYLVSLQERSGRHHCGATILRAEWLLTAAHCITLIGNSKEAVPVKPLDLVAMVGSNKIGIPDPDKRMINIAAIHVHEGFEYIVMLNDIGIIQLEEAMNLNSPKIGVVTIPSSLIPLEDPNSSGDCVALGWGVVRPESKLTAGMEGEKVYERNVQLHNGPSTFLNMVKLALYPVRSCMKQLRGVIQPWIHLCTYTENKDACKADSGGPLICNGEQWGITSWGRGVLRETPPECGQGLITISTGSTRLSVNH